MSNTVRIRVAALVLLAALPAAAQDWRGRGRMQGLITDQDDQPIAGASVTARREGKPEEGPAPVKTDKHGRWSIAGLASGTWEVVVEAAGYVPAGGSFRVIEASVGPGEALRISLRPGSAAPAAPSENPAYAAIARGNELLLGGKYAEARTEYQQALTTIPDSGKPAVLRGVAQACWQEGKKDDAFASLRRALELAPEDVETLKLMVGYLVAAGREPEAQQYMAKLPADTAMDPASLLNLGIQKYNEGKMDDALAYFARVVKENPTMAEAYYFRGLTYLAQGKSAEAKADFLKLLEIAPEHEKAAEVKEFLTML